MKKNRLSVFSISIALVLSACAGNNAPQSNNTPNSKDDNNSTINIDNSQNNSENNTSDGNNSSEQSSSSSQESKEEIDNDNFTVLVPTNLSSMSDNCKKYVDDMRAQQQRLIQQKGANADYYINDLFGTSGVDITKGVTPSSNNYQDNTGGYRDGVTANEYLDEIDADWEKGEKSDESKGIEIEFQPADSLKNKQYTIT